MDEKKFRLTSPMPPSVNHYMGYRAVPRVKKGRKVYIVVPYLTTEAREYQEQFAKYAIQQVKEQQWDIEETRNRHYYMDCVYYFPRIDMDEQNYPKCMSDALNGIAYIDDNFILTRTNRVFYDVENPRVELVISKVEYIGIFDNEEELEKFEEKCKTCKRYKRNCSILKKAKEGRIQEEINEEKHCIKYSAKRQ
ncbi:RusA family crossover junction endodeoxyribonuclease [Brevibacillus laterosporus]|nr:RusA family crossover junction endodeoxyribonuclease [Brevibacillus laterosporus]TPG68559.1 RusA family crossover junction endodeoxyribonuclease [Brevibacillus laterosporus]